MDEVVTWYIVFVFGALGTKVEEVGEKYGDGGGRWENVEPGVSGANAGVELTAE
jgi:hypothetical protein